MIGAATLLTRTRVPDSSLGYAAPVGEANASVSGPSLRPKMVTISPGARASAERLAALRMLPRRKNGPVSGGGIKSGVILNLRLESQISRLAAPNKGALQVARSGDPSPSKSATAKLLAESGTLGNSSEASTSRPSPAGPVLRNRRDGSPLPSVRRSRNPSPLKSARYTGSR